MRDDGLLQLKPSIMQRFLTLVQEFLLQPYFSYIHYKGPHIMRYQ